MLTPFLYTLRKAGVPVGTQEWLTLMDALSQDLAESSLTRFYYLARAILVKSESLYDSFDQAFLICFKGKENTLNIEKEVLDWLDKYVDPANRPALDPSMDKLTLDELIKKFQERLKEQKEEHHGGNHWVGTGGTSPFGHGGSHPSGIRIGGAGGVRMAVKIAEERRFANYRQDRILDTRQFKVALKRLRKLNKEGPAVNLNLDKSIDQTCKNAGDIELVFEPERKNQTELILIMDVGGTMDPYAELVDSLFSAAHGVSHFKHFNHYYFHNCVYSRLFTNGSLREGILLEDIFKKHKKTSTVIYVGDAMMNPYELFAAQGSIDYWSDEPTPGITWMKRLKDHFPSSVWLNPEPEHYWSHPTIASISNIFKMYPLTVKGLTEAIDDIKSGEVKPRLSHFSHQKNNLSF